jgi:hypothetical protein
MNRRRLLGSLFVASVAAAAHPSAIRAQGWSVDVSAGHIVYRALDANIGASNVVGTLRYDAARGVWIYGSAAAPLRAADTFWAATGGSGRFVPSNANRRRAVLGVDLMADGFLFRDRLAVVNGSGTTIEALPFARLGNATTAVEVRGGWRGQALSLGGASERRGVFETGARVTHDAAIGATAGVHWVRATEGTFPFAGGSISYNGTPVQVWFAAGRWMDDLLDDVSAGAGVGVALGAETVVWARARQEAPDPLYWNSARRTWSVGITRQFGGRPRAILPVPRRENGAVVVRVPVNDAPEDGLSIAGDFNKWQPQPMRREGREWVLRIPLAPGVYNYAFRKGNGDWFVPASIPGRRDDGFGGHVAVLVVS